MRIKDLDIMKEKKSERERELERERDRQIEREREKERERERGSKMQRLKIERLDERIQRFGTERHRICMHCWRRRDHRRVEITPKRIYNEMKRALFMGSGSQLG